jgi:ABC-2 type transport system permease protein
MFANIVFGFLRCSVFQAVAAGAGRFAGGYDASQLATYVWAGQGLIGTVLLWTQPELVERIRTGEVVTDLLRPVNVVWQQLANDLGWAGYGALTRFVGPMIVGIIAFDLYAPRAFTTYLFFLISVVLAVVVCFGCRFLLAAVTYWLLDARGTWLSWSIASVALSGMQVPLWFLPTPAATVLYVGTPIASIIQAPLDILVERAPAAPVLVLQAVWVVVLLCACHYVQRRAERRLVIQGG